MPGKEKKLVLGRWGGEQCPPGGNRRKKRERILLQQWKKKKSASLRKKFSSFLDPIKGEKKGH